MNMRNALRYVIVLAATGLLVGAGPGPTTQQTGVVQTVFEGDRICGDNPTDCAYPGMTALHRYLHVVVHDVPGYAKWGVWIGAQCEGTMLEATGAIPVGASGFVEAVVDLRGTGDRNWQGQSLCFLFRGGFGRAVTYYAGYVDDTPTANAQQVLPSYERMGGRPDLPDLDVTLIHRTPTYAYDAIPNAPRRGQKVTYEANVSNVGGRPVPRFSYRWLLDGREVLAGDSSAALGPFATRSFSLELPGTIADHTLTFRAVTNELQLSTANDSLSIDTNAITLGFWVEKSAYSYFGAYQARYCAVQGCAGSDSFEDWLQRQVRSWNDMFRRARYDGLTPDGIVTRARVDKVVVVPDGSLPLHGGIASDSPDRTDHTVDLQWGLPSAGVEAAYPVNAAGPFRVDWALLHELSHARSLADWYRFDFPVDSPSTIDIRSASGRPVYDPSQPYAVTNKIRGYAGSDGGTLLYQNEERDLMSCVCADFYGPYSALVLNRLGTSRARCGNYNPPCDLGDWYLDSPPQSALSIRSASGRKLGGPATVVRLFYDSGTGYGTHRFIQSDSAVLSPRNAVFDLPPDLFRAGGAVERAGHNLLLVEITASGIDRFCFQEPTTFNEAYWEGYSDARTRAVFTLDLAHITQNACHLSLPRQLVNEPFGTSPVTSTARLGPRTRDAGGSYRRAAVRLLDAASVPMRGRHIVLRAEGGAVVATGTTGSDGRFAARLPAALTNYLVDDVTDNGFTLASE